MFKKAAVFTDLHLGNKNNSQQHNQDCEEFIDWYIHTAKENNCETGIFCGDFNHHRNSINVATLNTSINILEKLGKAFDQFFMFDGNHDLYYKDRRDLNSTAYARHVDGITHVTDIYQVDDVCLVPWLVQDEWKKIKDIDAKYIFGHFELPSFYMNAMVQMPDHGELKVDDFSNQRYVFSGHFHKRQVQGNVHYIGNAFPHNYADAWDDDRGMMILDRENDLEPQYFNWADCPKYRTVLLSELIDKTDEIMKSKMNLRVTIDCSLSFEEASYVKEKFMEDYDVRELRLIPKQQMDDVNSDIDVAGFSSVNQIVTENITDLDTDTFDKRVLLDIYNGL